MNDFVLVIIIGAIISCAVAYIIKEKKRGIQCIGCPNESCSKKSCESMKEYYSKIK